MIVEKWESSQTRRFLLDVAHYLPGDARVEQWRHNIEQDPFIGAGTDGLGQLALLDYEIEGFVVRYVLLAEKRQIIFVRLSQGENTPGPGSDRVRKAWQLLVEALAAWSGLR
jgi:hypothetical protein